MIVNDDKRLLRSDQLRQGVLTNAFINHTSGPDALAKIPICWNALVQLTLVPPPRLTA